MQTVRCSRQNDSLPGEKITDVNATGLLSMNAANHSAALAILESK
jgi:hypothetical protein